MPQLKMARASQEELDALRDFMSDIGEKIHELPLEELGEWLMRRYSTFDRSGYSAERVITGYETLFSNACDPTLQYLEFKPEILAAMGATSNDIPSRICDGCRSPLARCAHWAGDGWYLHWMCLEETTPNCQRDDSLVIEWPFGSAHITADYLNDRGWHVI